MNAVLSDVSLFSFLKIINPKVVDLRGLEAVRNQLLGKVHNAENVGKSGGEWLESVLNFRIIEDIRKFPRSNHQALLVRGIQISTDLPSPSTGFLREDQCVLDFDILLFGMLELLGIRPHAVTYENYGKLVRNVVPVNNAKGTRSSWGADIDFAWHTDNPNWPFSDKSDDVKQSVPDYLAFVAVRNHEKASTDVNFIGNVLEELPCWTIEQLCRCAYTFTAPASNENFIGSARRFPILEYAGHNYRIRFDEELVSAIDSDSKEALDVFKKCVNKLEGMSIILEQGDFLIFKNTVVLHRRKAFTPHSEDKARWLRRIYGS